MCEYLDHSRPTYRFRRVVPADVRHIITKPKIWWYSLKTKDRAEAKRRCQIEAVRTTALIDAARAQLEPSLPTSPEQLRWERAERDHLDAQEAEELGRESDNSAMAERMKPHLAVLDGIMSAPIDQLNSRERAIRERLSGANYDLQTARYAERAARAQLQQAKTGGVQVAAVPASGDALPGDPVKLEPLLQAYAAEQGTRSKRGLASSFTHVRSLRDFLPSDDARLATPERIIAWKDYLLRPAKDGGRGVGTKTVNDGYLATARALLGWAAMNRRIASNPVDGIRVRVTAQPQVRERAFTDGEAAKVLAATFVSRPRLAAHYQLACKWVPWLLAYSGARVGEVAQLRAEDVMTVDGVRVLRITPEAGSVKTGKYRYVPLHSHLVDMGFVKVAEAKGSGPLFYAPEAATRRGENSSKSLSEKVSAKLRDMVRGAGISAAEVSQPNHAWRHRFKTKSRRWGLDTEAAHHIQGHATDSEGQDYGSWPVERLAAEIEKLPRYKIKGA